MARGLILPEPTAHLVVEAVDAVAVLVAVDAGGKALAVELETVGPLAVAVFLLPPVVLAVADELLRCKHVFPLLLCNQQSGKDSKA